VRLNDEDRASADDANPDCEDDEHTYDRNGRYVFGCEHHHDA
jgi:plastocyanin